MTKISVLSTVATTITFSIAFVPLPLITMYSVPIKFEATIWSKPISLDDPLMVVAPSMVPVFTAIGLFDLTLAPINPSKLAVVSYLPATT